MDIPNIFKSGPNYSKLKTNLRLIVNRLKLLEKKRTELAQKARIEIADYIRSGKLDRARVRVEHIIREDYNVEAMEIVEMYADLLLARFGLIETMKGLDPGLEESVASILWATPRLQAEVPEFGVVSRELAAKYGVEFADACRQNSLNNVSDKLMHKMSISSPPPSLIEKYMIVIADTYKVDYEPDKSLLSAEEVLTLNDLLPPKLQPKQLPSPSQEPAIPRNNYQQPSQPVQNQQDTGYGFNLPEVPNSAPTTNNDPGSSMNFDDLEARFNRLKKK